MRGPVADGGGDNVPFVWGTSSADAGVGVGSVGDSEDKTRSGGSRTAESTRIFVIRCSAGVTSAGFHSSSSTNFADCDIRA
jgi:hypothetical protein